MTENGAKDILELLANPESRGTYTLLVRGGFSMNEAIRLSKLNLKHSSSLIYAGSNTSCKLGKWKKESLARNIPLSLLSGKVHEENLHTRETKELLYTLGFESYKLCVGKIMFNNKPFVGIYLHGVERSDEGWMKSGNATDRGSVKGRGGVGIYEKMIEKIQDEDFEELSLDELDMKLYSDPYTLPEW